MYVEFKTMADHQGEIIKQIQNLRFGPLKKGQNW